jgi:hypothetical protein
MTTTINIQDQKNLRCSGAKVLLRGTTLLAFFQKIIEKKPLRIALSGDSRRQLTFQQPL